MSDNYYHVSSAARYIATPTAAFAKIFRQRFPCLHRPDDSAIDIDLESIGDSAPLTACQGTGLDLIRNDFTAILGDDLLKNVELRPVRKNGIIIPEYYCMGSPTRYRIRGGPKSTRQFCDECGRFLYYPMDEWYFLRGDLTGQSVYYGGGL